MTQGANSRSDLAEEGENWWGRLLRKGDGGDLGKRQKVNCFFFGEALPSNLKWAVSCDSGARLEALLLPLFVVIPV